MRVRVRVIGLGLGWGYRVRVRAGSGVTGGDTGGVRVRVRVRVRVKRGDLRAALRLGRGVRLGFLRRLALPRLQLLGQLVLGSAQGGEALLELSQLRRRALGRRLGVALRRGERELPLGGLLPRLPRLRLRGGLG